MKKICFSLLLMMAVCTSQAQGYQAVYGDIQNSLAVIKGGQIIGYGFFVDKNIVVASYSSVSKYTYATMSFLQHEKTYTINGYLAADPVNDLVLLEVVCDSGVPVKFFTGSVSSGMKVLLVDPEPSSINRLMEATIDALKDYGDTKLMHIKGATLLQNAGLPVMTESGQVLGMSTKSPIAEMNLNFAVPADTIRALLLRKSTLKKLEMLKPTLDHINSQNQPGQDKSEVEKEYLDQGNARIAQKDYKGAIDKFTMAIRINPNDADAYVFRGQAKYLLMEYKDAISDFNKAIDIQSEYAEAYDLRGIAKAELGDKTGACEDWQKAFELGFNPAFKLLKEFCDIDKMK